MSNLLPNLLERFATRLGGLGQVYVHKTAAGAPCLALVSKASKPEGVDAKKMCATFVVTSDDPDRVDDVVMSKGLVLTHFKTNPIGLYGHGQMILPIGKWEDPSGKLCLWPRDKQTTGTLYFSQKTEHAAQVFALVEEGILRACSVGFNPLEEPESRGRGFRFTKTDLLEISVVAVPAQPTATLVRQVLSRNKLAGGVILEPIRKSLLPLCEAKPVKVAGGYSTERVEEIVKGRWSEQDHPRDEDGKFDSGGGGKHSNHGYSSEDLAEMSAGQRRILAARMGMRTAGKTDEEILAALTPAGKAPSSSTDATEEGQKPAGKVLPKAPPLSRAEHATALTALLAAAQKGEREGGLDPRGDLKHLPTGEKLRSAQTAILGAVAEHIAARTVGPPLGDIYAGVAHGLTPEAFRAVMIDLHQSGAIRLSGWPRMPDDLPRPDVAPVVSGKIMYYAQQSPRQDKVGEEMSKKWRKAAPVKTPASGRLMPTGSLKKLLDMIPQEEKDALQECVSAKIPKLLEEGYSEEQAQAIAFSVCREEKALGGASGTAGGLTVTEEQIEEKQVTRLEALVDRVLKATAAVRKQPPPPPHTAETNGELPDQQQDEDQQDGPPEPGTGRADPKDVLSRLVDALSDYIDLTTKPAPTQAAPEVPGEDDEEEEDEEGDMDLDGTQEDMDEEAGMDRYQFRTAKPQHAKAMLCKECMGKMCKNCKQMMEHEGEQEETDGEGGDDPIAMPEQTKTLDLVDTDNLDERAILTALGAVRDRASAVANAWNSLQGTMP